MRRSTAAREQRIEGDRGNDGEVDGDECHVVAELQELSKRQVLEEEVLPLGSRSRPVTIAAAPTR